MSEFEKAVFARGVFVRSDEQILAGQKTELDGLRETHGDAVVSDREAYNRRHFAWLRHYRGKIPASWDDVQAIAEDIRRAHDERTILEPTLVEAVLTHPMAFPLLALSGFQRLNAHELAIVIARRDPYYVKDSVSINQRLLGVSHQVWREAGKIVRIAKEEGRSLIPHLRA